MIAICYGLFYISDIKRILNGEIHDSPKYSFFATHKIDSKTYSAFFRLSLCISMHTDRTKNSFCSREEFCNALQDATFLIKWVRSIRMKQAGIFGFCWKCISNKASIYSDMFAKFAKTRAAEFNNTIDISELKVFGTSPTIRINSWRKNDTKLILCISEIIEKTGIWNPSDGAPVCIGKCAETIHQFHGLWIY